MISFGNIFENVSEVIKLVGGLGGLAYLISLLRPLFTTSVTITYPRDNEKEWKGDIEGTFRPCMLCRIRKRNLFILFKRRGSTYYTVLGTPKIDDDRNWKLSSNEFDQQKNEWRKEKLKSSSTSSTLIEEITAIITEEILEEGQEIPDIPKTAAKYSVRRIDNERLRSPPQTQDTPYSHQRYTR